MTCSSPHHNTAPHTLETRAAAPSIQKYYGGTDGIALTAHALLDDDDDVNMIASILCMGYYVSFSKHYFYYLL
jgi:hypothetical protein